MEVRNLSIHTVLFSALVITLSANSVCAQKFKYKPLPKGAKSVTVPSVVNPNLPLAVQENITRWSGVAVLRPNATPKATPPLVTPSHTTVKPLSAKDLTPAATSAKISSLPAQISLAPVQAAVADTGTNLTGIQVLSTYFPTWRQELGGMFSKEQLDAVENAFAVTDERMFVRGEDGELTMRNKDEWNYEDRFLTILHVSGVSFTDRQIKQLIGGRGIKGFTFNIYFSRMNAVGFSCAKGAKPRKEISRKGHPLPRKEMTPEEIQEVNIGQGLHNNRNHPAVIAYMKENRLYKTAEEYVALARKYPTKPRQHISRKGHILTPEEMTPEEAEEVKIGLGLHTHRNHPAVIAYMKENRLQAERKTAEEYVALARQYPTKPRPQIYRDGHILTREEMTPEEIQEVIIGKGLNTHRNHPAVIAYMKENRLQAEGKTAEEYVALARQYPTKPRSVIYRDRHILTREEMTPEEIQEVIIGKGLCTNRNHPAVIAYMKENRLHAEAQIPEQLYTALVTHIKDYGHFPIQKETALQKKIYDRLKYYQSTMVDGKYQDPWLQKIYELKTAVENAPEGKFTIVPDGQGGYILKIEEPALEEGVTAPQPVEEVAPAAPSPHTIRLRITEQTKNLIESVRDAAALERREFPGWLRSMHSTNNFPQIVDANTFDALHVLNRAINFDYRSGQNRRAVTYLLQTVNNYVGVLGEQPELGAFYKLIYRGKADSAMLPSADNFHIVAEEQGLSWDGALAPQVEKVNRLLTQAAKQDTPFSVYLDGDEEMLTTIRTEGKVSAKTIHDDLSTVLKHLLPPGYEVRMGLHEVGISGRDLSKFRKGYLHIHLEHASVPNDDMEGLLIDHSISLDMDVRRFATYWNSTTQKYEVRWDKDIAQNYLELFDSFLSDEARQKLQEMATSDAADPRVR